MQAIHSIQLPNTKQPSYKIVCTPATLRKPIVKIDVKSKVAAKKCL